MFNNSNKTICIYIHAIPVNIYSLLVRHTATTLQRVASNIPGAQAHSSPNSVELRYTISLINRLVTKNKVNQIYGKFTYI